MKILGTSLTLVAVLSGWAFSPKAAAQAYNPRSDNTGDSVRTRARPEYDATGIGMGGFRLFPELSLTGEYTDNAYGDNNNKQSDTIGAVEGGVRLSSDWNTDALNFSAHGRSQTYSKISTESRTDWGAALDGRLDVSHDFYVAGGLDSNNNHEDFSRSTVGSVVAEPVPYTERTGFVDAVADFNIVRISLDARESQYNYDDVKLLGGGTIDEDDRDDTISAATLRFDFGISPDTAFFVSGSANKHDFRLDPPASGVTIDRDSKGYEVLTGLDFEVTRLVHGQLGVGYLHQTYDEPGVPAASGVAISTDLEWDPDELWSVGVKASREVHDPDAVGAFSYVASTGGVSVDHELARNIILGFKGAYERDEFNGIDRTDTSSSETVQVDYALNRDVSLYVNAGHYSLKSDGVAHGNDYEINRGMIGLRFRR